MGLAASPKEVGHEVLVVATKEEIHGRHYEKNSRMDD